MSKSAKKIPLAKEPGGKDAGSLASAWSPLRESVFRALWIATAVFNIGTWMEDVGESWLMAYLTPSPVRVGLVETFGSLPVVLLALPAGALADIVDRRRLLLVMQSWMVVSAGAMGVLALMGQMTPARLLSLTFLLGIGAAMSNPGWQAITPELVRPTDLPAAITLSVVSFNVARAIGPAVGGFIIGASGPWAVFFLNAASLIAIMVVVYRWRPAPRRSKLPPEDIIGAMRSGTLYLRNSPELQTVMVRTGIFAVCASGLCAFVAQEARRGLGLGSFGYGLLLGCIGLGAIIGAWLLPKIRERLSVNGLVAAGTVVFALATLSLAYIHSFGVLAGALAGGGVGWIAVLSSLTVSAQTVTPSWVRARVMAVYLLVFMGGLAVGSAVRGFVVARLGGNTNLPLPPQFHCPDPIVMIDAEPQEGPAITIIEYRIDPKTADEFLQAMKEMKRIRQRDGAIRWNLSRDTADPERYLQTFVTESWGDHLRQHERVTAENREVEQRAQAFHLGPEPPKITHLIAEEMPK